MMKKQKILFFSTLLCTIFFMNIYCKKENSEIIPKQTILGKWELRKKGTSLDFLSDVPVNGYTEFLNDSTYRDYDYSTQTFTNGDYAINDSMLVYYYYALNGNKVDTISVRYYYTFKDKKNLILDIDASAILRTFVYEKIK